MCDSNYIEDMRKKERVRHRYVKQNEIMWIDEGLFYMLFKIETIYNHGVLGLIGSIKPLIMIIFWLWHHTC